MMGNLGVKDVSGCPSPISCLKVSHQGIYLYKISTRTLAFGIISKVSVEDLSQS